MSSHFNHRSMAPTSAPSRLGDLLDAVKTEYETLTQDLSHFKLQRDEFEHKISAQINEMSAFQQNVFELERNHQKIKQSYEEEIMRLRRELEQRSGQPTGGPSQHPLPNIGHGPSSLFTNIVGGPPQLIDPAQGQQPQSHSSFPPTSNPNNTHPYLNGGPPGSQALNPISSQIPPGGQDMHLPKRLRSDSQVGPLPAIQSGGGSLPPGYNNNSNHPPSSHLPPGMHPLQNPNMQGGNKLIPPMQSQLNTPGPEHPGQHLGLSTGMGPGGLAKRKNGDNPPQPQNSGNSSRPQTRHSPGPPQSIISTNPLANGISDLDPDTIPPQLKREGGDWFAIFNPKVQRVLNVELVSTLDHNSVVCCVRFSNDGKYLATGCNRTAQIYDVTTSQKICVLVDDSVNKNDDLYIRSVCFSPDGKYLATGAEDKLIRIWDIKKKFIVHLFQGHEQDIYSLDFSRDGRFIVSGSGDRTARLWDMETRKCLFTLDIDDHSAKDAGVTSVALSPDSRLVAAGSLDRLIRIWDATTGQLLDKLEGHKDSVYSVAFSADGKTLCSGSLDKTLKVWELGHFNRNSSSSKNATSVCRANFVGHKDFVLSVACSPCGNWVVSGSKDRGVQFWDPRTSQTQFMLQGHKNSVISVALSPAGRLFATGSGDCRARLWSYENLPSSK